MVTELHATSSSAASRSAQLRTAGNKELATVESACARAATSASERSAALFCGATARRDAAVTRLTQLRSALRQQHQAAEAAHAAALGDEQQAELQFLQMQSRNR
ncbi:unnamed protein product [Polarella glacialis]|uniref:Uncharacterized protein n=1 Tax=Polarella glacialis TaxID=89957 RepID=A0A813LGV5_POLGL|nr:unnamed protein product [Polarella glacialis]